jgi:uncharacterized membrane protein (UPF0127 family)
MASFLRPLLGDSPQPYQLVNERNGRVIASRLITAFDSETRRTGLLRHDGFPPGSAMIIAPTNAIHTLFMKFPIDALFAAKDGRVLKARVALPPWRMAAAWGAHAVIELPSHTLADADVKAGDRVIVVARDEAFQSP